MGEACGVTPSGGKGVECTALELGVGSGGVECAAHSSDGRDAEGGGRNAIVSTWSSEGRAVTRERRRWLAAGGRVCGVWSENGCWCVCVCVLLEKKYFVVDKE